MYRATYLEQDMAPAPIGEDDSAPDVRVGESTTFDDVALELV